MLQNDAGAGAPWKRGDGAGAAEGAAGDRGRAGCRRLGLLGVPAGARVGALPGHDVRTPGAPSVYVLSTAMWERERLCKDLLDASGSSGGPTEYSRVRRQQARKALHVRMIALRSCPRRRGTSLPRNPRHRARRRMHAGVRADPGGRGPAGRARDGDDRPDGGRVQGDGAGGLSQRPLPAAAQHSRHRGRHRRPRRHADGRRARGALRPSAAAPAARPRRPQRPTERLHACDDLQGAQGAAAGPHGAPGPPMLCAEAHAVAATQSGAALLGT